MVGAHLSQVHIMNPINNAIRDTFLAVLNEATAADAAAIQTLVEGRVRCGIDLADHPTIQVAEAGPGQFSVGTLGILNGVLERLTGERIAASYDETDKLIGFIAYPVPFKARLV